MSTANGKESDALDTTVPDTLKLPFAFILRFSSAAAALIFLILLFCATVTAATHTLLFSGALGVYAVPLHGVLFLMFSAVAAYFAHHLSSGSTSDQRQDAWARVVLLTVFVIFLNAFLVSARGFFHWGIVIGHDEPQYYAYLHSWVFDRDVNFENELKSIAGAWEMMVEAHPERPEYNVAPVGSAVVWLPFYLAAHALLTSLTSLGVVVPTDGMAAPYALAAAFGSHFAVLLGMLMLFQTLRTWFSPRTSVLATLLMWLATPLTWYLTDQPWMSHACSFFSASLVFYVWCKTRESRSLFGWAALGAAIGLAMLVRPSHAVLLVLPLLDLIRNVRDPRRVGRYTAGLGICVGLMLIAYLPQILVWRARYPYVPGSAMIGGTMGALAHLIGIEPPPGSPMQWSHPAIVEVLFSAHHGLFSWHPILILGFIGLIGFWRRGRFETMALVAVLAAYLYANAAIESWYGGGAFGMRRMVGVLPFMAPGLAFAGAWLVGLCRRHIMIPVAALISVVFLYNALLIAQFRAGWVDILRPPAFSDIWSSSAIIFHQWFGNPFSYPANLAFAYTHGVSPSQYDVATGVPPNAELDAAGPAVRYYLGRGWETDLRFAALMKGSYLAYERETELLLYMRKGHAYNLGLTMILPRDMREPQRVAFAMNDSAIGEAQLEPGATSVVEMHIPANTTLEGLNVLTLRFSNMISKKRESAAENPRGLELDTRKPVNAVALLQRIQLQTYYSGEVLPAPRVHSAAPKQ